MSATDTIRFDNVSKFYGEVLGVNRISLTLSPGITTLVGPNGSGKTTLMNLMTGLVAVPRYSLGSWPGAFERHAVLLQRRLLRAV